MSLARRLAVVFALGSVQSLLYLWLNHRPPRPSSELPLLWLDRATPFLPWTVWPYLVLLASEVVFPLLLRERESFRRLVRAWALAMAVAFATYAFFPTHYPRPPAPDDPSVTSFACRALFAFDQPECCLPSGHVLVPLLGAWSLARERGWLWPTSFVVLLLPSVLTTKQHYLLDVLGALVLATAAWLASRTRTALGP